MISTPNPEPLELTVISERTMDPATAARLRLQFLPKDLTPQDQPIVYAMAGIPGSGKSVYVDAAIERGELPRNAYLLDPDRVMMAMPEYIDDISMMGAASAFRHWEIPARLLAYDMAQEAAEKRYHIIQDMGSVRRENLDRLSQFKQRGYRIQMTYVFCPVDEALRRLQTRAGRYTAAAMVKERAASLNLLLPAYVDLCDSFRVLDNSDPDHPFQETTLDAVMG